MSHFALSTKRQTDPSHDFKQANSKKIRSFSGCRQKNLDYPMILKNYFLCKRNNL